MDCCLLLLLLLLLLMLLLLKGKVNVSVLCNVPLMHAKLSQFFELVPLATNLAVFGS